MFVVGVGAVVGGGGGGGVGVGVGVGVGRFGVGVVGVVAIIVVTDIPQLFTIATVMLRVHLQFSECSLQWLRSSTSCL